MTLAVPELPLWRAQRDSMRQPQLLHAGFAFVRAIIAAVELFLVHVRRTPFSEGRTRSRTFPGASGPIGRADGAPTADGLIGAGYWWTTACSGGTHKNSAPALRSEPWAGSGSLKPLISRPGESAESPLLFLRARVHEKRNTCECDGAGDACRDYGGRPASGAAG